MQVICFCVGRVASDITDLMGVIGNRGNRGEAPYSPETEGLNHAALVFEEGSRELCMSSIASVDFA